MIVKSKCFIAIWTIALIIIMISAVFDLQEQFLIIYHILVMHYTLLNLSIFVTAIINRLIMGTTSVVAVTSITDGF